jgi:hypothetical protein
MRHCRKPSREARGGSLKWLEEDGELAHACNELRRTDHGSILDTKWCRNPSPRIHRTDFNG